VLERDIKQSRHQAISWANSSQGYRICLACSLPGEGRVGVNPPPAAPNGLLVRKIIPSQPSPIEGGLNAIAVQLPPMPIVLPARSSWNTRLDAELLRAAADRRGRNEFVAALLSSPPSGHI
jgi:hypothetical protein